MVSRREGVRTIGYVIEKAPKEEPRYTKKYKRRSEFDVLKKMEPGDSIVVTVSADTGGYALAAWSVTISYDRSVVSHVGTHHLEATPLSR